MPSRQNALAKLAEAFGRCLLENSTHSHGQPASPGDRKRERLRRIARLMDHLSRQPDSLQWHRRIERVHQEIAGILQTSHRARPESLWAKAA